MSGNEDILNKSVREFAAATAAKSPTPGGGSVAGAVGSLSAALGEMSLNFTRGKKKYAEHEEYYAQLATRLENARKMFENLVADDIQAYKLYQEAQKQEDGPDKQQAVQLATAAAIDVPRETTKLSLAVLKDLEQFADKCNPWLITDLMASAALAVATIQLSDYNVCVNIPSVSDKSAAEEILQSSKADLAKAKELFEIIEKAGFKILGY